METKIIQLTNEIDDIHKKIEKLNSDLTGFITEDDLGKKLLVAYQDIVYNINGIPPSKDFLDEVRISFLYF